MVQEQNFPKTLAAFFSQIGVEMRITLLGIVLIATGFSLAGCAAMSDPNSFWYMPPLTAQQQCELDHGRWTTVQTYDASGQPTGPSTSECATRLGP